MLYQMLYRQSGRTVGQSAGEGNPLFSGRLGTDVEVLGSISKMDAFGAFLTAFNSDKRDRGLASRDLLHEFGGCQVRTRHTSLIGMIALYCAASSNAMHAQKSVGALTIGRWCGFASRTIIAMRMNRNFGNGWARQLEK
jgi:hypothetical protein